MISVRRLKTKFYPNPKRVIARFFMPGAERARSIVDMVIQLPGDKVHSILNHVFEDFSERFPAVSSFIDNTSPNYIVIFLLVMTLRCMGWKRSPALAVLL